MRGRRRCASSRAVRWLGCIRRIGLCWGYVSGWFLGEIEEKLEGAGEGWVGLGWFLYIPVSPASPENAIKVCLFSCRVLSSAALRIVAPRMAALEAAISVKSEPVMPRRTSLCVCFHFMNCQLLVWRKGREEL